MRLREQAIVDLSNLDNGLRVRIRLELLKKGNDLLLAIFEEMLSCEKIKKNQTKEIKKFDLEI